MSRNHGHKTAGDENYHREIVVSASANAAYHALTRQIDGWWAAPEGDAFRSEILPLFDLPQRIGRCASKNWCPGNEWRGRSRFTHHGFVGIVRGNV